MLTTIWRARTIVKNNEVKLIEARATPFIRYHFQVKQRNGDWTDVWWDYNKKSNQMEWNCNAVTKKKLGGSWGCVMYTKDKKEPYCSHTLACKILKCI